jgi:MFS family permease
MRMQGHSSGVLLRTIVIGLTAFLTVVDLFATQAILPSLARAYQVTPAAMGFAVNSSTMGMAVAGLAVSLFSQRINRRLGILISLSILSIPTALLAVAPDLTTFTALRIAQGLCMASAFTLTLAYLGEECRAADAGGAFAAYITGNVASNLIGRLVSAAVADHLGLAWNFYFFAALNLAGAVLVYYTVAQSSPMMQMGPVRALRLRRGSCICAIRDCVPLSASDPASCLLSSARSPTSTSSWCDRRYQLARCNSDLFISCSCLQSLRRCWPAAPFIAGVLDRPSGVLWHWLGLDCHYSCYPLSRQSCWAWCWSALARFSPRQRRPAS